MLINERYASWALQEEMEKGIYRIEASKKRRSFHYVMFVFLLWLWDNIVVHELFENS